ncbi:MAG: AtpZ/AtpI family protein [Thermotogota bacterium]|nr:AtpZ/AtpI family protein [Thermotogota bacterium]
MNKKDEKVNLPRELKKLNLIPYFGFTVFANMAVSGLIGYYLDKWTFDNKIIFIISLFFGMISGIYNGIKELVKESKQYEEKSEEKDENTGEKTSKKNS